MVVFFNFSDTVFMFMSGFRQAGCIVVGNALGENRPRLAKRYFHVCLMLATAVSWTMLALIFIFKSPIAAIYFRDQGPKEMLGNAIGWLCLTYMWDLTQGFLQGPIRGLGFQLEASKISLVSFYIVALPSGYYMAFNLGLSIPGLWMGVGIGAFI